MTTGGRKVTRVANVNPNKVSRRMFVVKVGAGAANERIISVSPRLQNLGAGHSSIDVRWKDHKERWVRPLSPRRGFLVAALLGMLAAASVYQGWRDREIPELGNLHHRYNPYRSRASRLPAVM
jgi:hypothetical protein